MLKKGHKYRYPDGRIIMVIKVSSSSATVAPLGKTKPIDSESFTISKHSELEEV